LTRPTEKERERERERERETSHEFSSSALLFIFYFFVFAASSSLKISLNCAFNKLKVLQHGPELEFLFRLIAKVKCNTLFSLLFSPLLLPIFAPLSLYFIHFEWQTLFCAYAVVSITHMPQMSVHQESSVCVCVCVCVCHYGVYAFL